MSFLSNIFSTSEGKGRAFMLIKSERSAKTSNTVANSKKGIIVHVPHSGGPSDAARKLIGIVCKRKTRKVCKKTKEGKVCEKKKVGAKKSGVCTVNVSIVELETNPSGKVKRPNEPTPIPNAKVLKYKGKVYRQDPVEINGEMISFRKIDVRSLN